VDVNQIAKKTPQTSTVSSKKSFVTEGQQRGTGKQLLCFHCNKSDHDFKKCKFKKFVCSKCKKKGHIVAACKADIKTTHFNDTDSTRELDLFHIKDVLQIGSNPNGFVKPLCVNVLINSKPVCMEVDTAAGISCLPYDLYKLHFSNVKL